MNYSKVSVNKNSFPTASGGRSVTVGNLTLSLSPLKVIHYYILPDPDKVTHAVSSLHSCSDNVWHRFQSPRWTHLLLLSSFQMGGNRVFCYWMVAQTKINMGTIHCISLLFHRQNATGEHEGGCNNNNI